MNLIALSVMTQYAAFTFAVLLGALALRYLWYRIEAFRIKEGLRIPPKRKARKIVNTRIRKKLEAAKDEREKTIEAAKELEKKKAELTAKTNAIAKAKKELEDAVAKANIATAFVTDSQKATTTVATNTANVQHTTAEETSENRKINRLEKLKKANLL